jgi:hypothetical protein
MAKPYCLRFISKVELFEEFMIDGHNIGRLFATMT